ADRLVHEAYAQDRRPPGEVADQLRRDPRLLRRTRPGRDDDPLRPQRLHLRHADLVVPPHLHRRPQLAQVLVEVVGERVVVIEQQDHRAPPLSNAECGVRNAESRGLSPARRVSLSSLFRIPHSAFRICSASSIARSAAPSLWKHSWYSASGWLSATMPAPACIATLPSRTIIVRRVV